MKKIIAPSILSLLCVCFSTMQSIAQPITNETAKAQLIKDWQRAKEYTVSYLDAMPADKYSFKPVDSMRSFAQQMLHLAASNAFLMATATDQPPLFGTRDLQNSPGAQATDSVRYYVTASYDFAINALKNMNASKLSEKTKVLDFEDTRYAFALKAFEHQTHHRGQTTIYIRLLGIRPPEERLF